MKLDGTLFINQILYKHNTFAREANEIGILKHADVLTEVLEFSEIIREIMAEMETENNLMIDYDSLYKRMSKCESEFDVEPATDEQHSKDVAWTYALGELLAFKERGGWPLSKRGETDGTTSE